MKEQLVELINDEEALNPSVDDAEGSKGGGGYVAPFLVRLAWHSAGVHEARTRLAGLIALMAIECMRCIACGRGHAHGLKLDLASRAAAADGRI